MYMYASHLANFVKIAYFSSLVIMRKYLWIQTPYCHWLWIYHC